MENLRARAQAAEEAAREAYAMAHCHGGGARGLDVGLVSLGAPTRDHRLDVQDVYTTV